MAMNGETAAFAGRRHRRRPVMAEINVTPMVDVMLVLLIIFMVSAPLLTVGVPLDLPQTQAKTLDQDKEPLTVSVNANGQVYLQNTEIAAEELVPKLKAITEALKLRLRNWSQSSRPSPRPAGGRRSASSCAATGKSTTAP